MPVESCGSSANDPVSRPTLVASRPTTANQNINIKPIRLKILMRRIIKHIYIKH